jgi:hypothetical protein
MLPLRPVRAGEEVSQEIAKVSWGLPGYCRMLDAGPGSGGLVIAGGSESDDVRRSDEMLMPEDALNREYLSTRPDTGSVVPLFRELEGIIRENAGIIRQTTQISRRKPEVAISRIWKADLLPGRVYPEQATDRPWNCGAPPPGACFGVTSENFAGWIVSLLRKKALRR